MSFNTMFFVAAVCLNNQSQANVNGPVIRWVTCINVYTVFTIDPSDPRPQRNKPKKIDRHKWQPAESRELEKLFSDSIQQGTLPKPADISRSISNSSIKHLLKKVSLSAIKNKIIRIIKQHSV